MTLPSEKIALPEANARCIAGKSGRRLEWLDAITVLRMRTLFGSADPVEADTMQCYPGDKVPRIPDFRPGGSQGLRFSHPRTAKVAPMRDASVPNTIHDARSLSAVRSFRRSSIGSPDSGPGQPDRLTDSRRQWVRNFSVPKLRPRAMVGRTIEKKRGNANRPLGAGRWSVLVRDSVS